MAAAVTVVVFSPHNDDAVLFAAYQCIRHDAYVVTVLRSELQARRGTGITAADRESEDACALAELRVTAHTQWPYSDLAPDWGAVENAMRLLDERTEPDLVLAPAVEPGGHEQHNAVGSLALRVYGARVCCYLTYRRGEGRSMDGVPVECEPVWVQRKLRALACYGSQIREPSTRPWFMEMLDVREWVTA